MAFTTTRKGQLLENFEMQIPGEVWVNISTIFVQGSQPDLSAIIHLVRETCNPRRLEDHLQQMLLRLEKPLMHEKASPATKNMPSLSPRERDVLSCLSLGKHAKDIAQQFGLSPTTVRSHIKNILYKLDVHSQLEAIAYAYQHRLL
jgi:DNA-binding NarL/FixJ family response regulator